MRLCSLSVLLLTLLLPLIGCGDATSEEGTTSDVEATDEAATDAGDPTSADAPAPSDADPDEGYRAILDATDEYVEIIAQVETVEDFEKHVDQMRENSARRAELRRIYTPLQGAINERLDTSSRSDDLRNRLNTEIMRIQADSALLALFEALLAEDPANR